LTSASGAGGIGYKSRADQISYTLQPCCVGPGAKPRKWAPLTRDTRKDINNEGLIFNFLTHCCEAFAAWIDVV